MNHVTRIRVKQSNIWPFAASRIVQIIALPLYLSSSPSQTFKREPNSSSDSQFGSFYHFYLEFLKINRSRDLVLRNAIDQSLHRFHEPLDISSLSSVHDYANCIGFVDLDIRSHSFAHVYANCIAFSWTSTHSLSFNITWMTPRNHQVLKIPLYVLLSA